MQWLQEFVKKCFGPKAKAKTPSSSLKETLPSPGLPKESREVTRHQQNPSKISSSSTAQIHPSSSGKKLVHKKERSSNMSRCRCCNRKLSDREMTRKYVNHEEIRHPEDKYVMLCNSCFNGTSILLAEVNPLLSDSNGEVDVVEEVVEETMNIYYQVEEDSQGDPVPAEE